MNQIQVVCLSHQENIEFLDLNQNVPLELRALCKKCELINPTNIEEAIIKWNKYKALQVKNIEKYQKKLCIPIKNIESSLISIKNKMNENIDEALKLIEFLKQHTIEFKDQKIEELESLEREKTLQGFQRIAQIVCDNQQINLKEFMEKIKIKEHQLKIKTINKKLDSQLQIYKTELQNIRKKAVSNIYDWYLEQGEYLIKLQQYDEAMKYYDKAIRIDPNDSGGYNNKGIALRKLQKYEEAIEYYEEAIKMDPNDSAAFFNKGNTLDELKKYNEAVECYDEAIRINPKDGDFFNNKGCVLETMGRLNEALAHYDQAISLNQNEFIYFESKGDVLVKLGRLNEAIQNYEESINKGHPNPLEINNKISAIQK